MRTTDDIRICKIFERHYVVASLLFTAFICHYGKEQPSSRSSDVRCSI